MIQPPDIFFNLTTKEKPKPLSESARTVTFKEKILTFFFSLFADNAIFSEFKTSGNIYAVHICYWSINGFFLSLRKMLEPSAVEEKMNVHTFHGICP